MTWIVLVKKLWSREMSPIHYLIATNLSQTLQELQQTPLTGIFCKTGSRVKESQTSDHMSFLLHDLQIIIIYKH